MLREEDRFLKPKDIKEQVPWETAEAVVILCLNKAGEINTLQMSSIKIEELIVLSKQLDAHVTHLIGMMKEV